MSHFALPEDIEGPLTNWKKPPDSSAYKSSASMGSMRPELNDGLQRLSRKFKTAASWARFGATLRSS